MGQVGLLWVGEKFYPTPYDFSQEAGVMGISRRIPALPKDFKLGETWVFLAHQKACWESRPETPWVRDPRPGIFRIFKPIAVEYVTRGDETPEELEKLRERGITPVKVVPAEEQQIQAA
jgi:hypothetical protein